MTRHNTVVGLLWMIFGFVLLYVDPKPEVNGLMIGFGAHLLGHE